MMSHSSIDQRSLIRSANLTTSYQEPPDGASASSRGCYHGYQRRIGVSGWKDKFRGHEIPCHYAHNVVLQILVKSKYLLDIVIRLSLIHI